MILNVVPAALGRLAASLIVALGALVLPSAAADRALINMLGYSSDGSHFAFEQYGIQDGSGFPFAEIFIVDLVNDAWVSGTPIEVRIDEESASLADAREQAMDQARAKLDALNVEVPVQVLALIGDGDMNASGMRVHWSTPACCGPQFTQADAQSLILQTRGITSNESYCEPDYGPVGYVLSFQDQNGVRELHADGDVLPSSRGCTLDYRIYAVVQPFENHWAEDFTSRRVAIIASYPFGFEGVDRRFLAVPIDR
jgi:predicted secreted protein